MSWTFTIVYIVVIAKADGKLAQNRLTYNNINHIWGRGKYRKAKDEETAEGNAEEGINQWYRERIWLAEGKEI